MVYTLEAASMALKLTRVVVSTEDEEIERVARLHGTQVLTRPPALARDETPGIEPVLHAIDAFPGFDYVVLLQPTSPLRQAADIDGAIETCLRLDAPACVSVCKSSEHPYWIYWINGGGRLRPVLKHREACATRQELPAAYALNGAVYVARIDWLRTSHSFLTSETVPFFMEKCRSLDIDTEEDIRICEYLLELSSNDKPTPPPNP